jgi:hypothetical protein
MANNVAFVPVCNGPHFGIGAAERNMSGYWPIPGHGVFKTWEDARAKADALNAELGVSPDDAAEIACSSMRTQRGKGRAK